MRNLALALVIACTACAAPLPMTSRMSDAVLMGTRPSKTPAVAYAYESTVADGLLTPVGKDRAPVPAGHPGYVHTESATLDRMVREYLALKFTALDESAPTKIKVTLKDFWLEQYSPDSGGKQFAAAMFGGEINIIVTAVLELAIEVRAADGTTSTKLIRAAGDNTHVSGFGTGTESSRLYRGKQGIEYVVADAVNAANNRALALLNQFLEANSI